MPPNDAMPGSDPGERGDSSARTNREHSCDEKAASRSDCLDPARVIRPASDPAHVPGAPLLQEPFARTWSAGVTPNDEGRVRERLLARARESLRAEARMHTVRRARTPRTPLAPGVDAQLLYRADPRAAPRRGEPAQALLVELAPGATLDAATHPGFAASSGRHREWLVLRGTAQIGDTRLDARDYHVRPAGTRTPVMRSDGGALVFLRESSIPGLPGDARLTVRDAEAGWPEFAPGIRRRVLWARDGQAALLYLAGPGASVPAHVHGHDEECLMVDGELFLDDLLLQPGDYQLAPAGTGHRITATDTGVVIYAHGDLDLRFSG